MKTALVSRRAVVERLAVLNREISTAARTALELAREAGLILLDVPRGELEDVIKQSGMSRTSAFNYMAVARRWDEMGKVQRAGLSIRGFLEATTPSVRTTSVREPEPKAIKVRTGKGLADDLSRALTSVPAGRTLSIKLSRADAGPPTDLRQPRLPFEDQD